MKRTLKNCAVCLLLYYDPWKKETIDEPTAMRLAFTPLLIPENHPVKLEYHKEFPEYSWEDVARPVAEAEDVVTDDSEYEQDDAADAR